MEQDIIPACVVVVVVVVVRSLVDVVKAVCSIMLLSSADIAISAQLMNISGRYPGELPTKSQFHFLLRYLKDNHKLKVQQMLVLN